ncbi:MAG: MFS transporter [Candidatus Pacebacteria bacterium]|nr:MFS transporter [Candidatus Paceibacterota bacterium]
MHRKSSHVLKRLFTVGFLFSTQVASTVYLNSSFLANRIPESQVGFLYIISSLISLGGMFGIPIVLQRIGSRILGSILAILIIAGLVGLRSVGVPTWLLGASFIIYLSAQTLLFLVIDVLIEHFSDHASMGRIRGMYLTACNIGFMIAPLVAGFLADRLGYGMLYTIAIAFVIPVWIIILRLPSIRPTQEHHSGIKKHLQTFLQSKNIRGVYVANFLLQFFYAWMVIYTPIYLHEHLGLAWDTIGLMFTIMLSAFVILQTPLGYLADRILGEKEILVGGFLVMGLSTLIFGTANLALFSLSGIAILLFITRIGASTIEVATESYFFKHIAQSDATCVGFFRNTYPIAYIIGPLLASALLQFIPIQSLFTILGIVCILGVFTVIKIKDTK